MTGPCGRTCEQCCKYSNCDTRLEAAWEFSRSDYSIEQLARAVPSAIAEWARTRARNEKRELVKGDLKLPFRNRDGSISCGGVDSALRMASHVKGVPAEILARAVKELERHRCKKEKAAMGITTSLDALIRLLEEGS
jgi:hypothetical protein